MSNALFLRAAASRAPCRPPLAIPVPPPRHEGEGTRLSGTCSTIPHGFLAGLVTLALTVSTVEAYPLYGSDDRGIGRVQAARLVQEGEIPGRKKVAGELLALEKVDLRLLGHRDLELPEPDAAFSAQIHALLGSDAPDYGIAVLDLTDPATPRYAEHNGTVARNPGSVGKMAVALALFQALADAWPGDEQARMQTLRDTVVTADEFIVYDSHKVRMWDRASRTLTRRALEVGDQGSLFEFMDWMLSASSNAAAAMVMREALLLAHAGNAYPLPAADGAIFFESTPRRELSDLLERTLQGAMSRNGIDLSKFRQGSLFTRTGKDKVPGTSSHGTAREMLRFLLRMEQGLLVDEWSSRELKRLLYMTERRIRYAASPALRDAAVYFKSGSLYECVEEAGFTCRKYQGNKLNLMNSVAIVESPAIEPRLFYLVALNSNVLRKNSAVDHHTLATRIHGLLEKMHGIEKKD